MVMRKLIQGAGVSAAALLGAAHAWAQDQQVGGPVPGGISLQTGFNPVYREAIGFHNYILLPIITAISLFVLGLLIYVVVKFNRKANPTPSRTTHNTLLEVVWTVVPVLILMFIAIFSFRLLYRYHDMPKADVTVKVTGNQWYWSYEYPELGDYAYDSRLIPEAEAKAKGLPYPYAADKPMIIPVNKNIRLLITGADVIHAVGVPSLGLKSDAIPGRINEVSFKAEKPGIYYGSCYELCGVDHAFMPLEIHALSEADYAAWAAANGPKKAPAAPAAAAAAPAAPGAAPAAPAPASAPAAPAAAAAPATAG